MKNLVCTNCNIEFGMPEEAYQRRVEDHRRFWCPNGHALLFNGPSPNEREIDRLRAIVEDQRETLAYYRGELALMTRRRAAMEGVATKRWLKIKSLQYRLGALGNR